MSGSLENRSLARLPCCIVVSAKGRSASLGEIQNISLDGVFLASDDKLPEGSVLPISFRLGEKGPEIRPEVEVMYRTQDGMGLRFLNMTSQDNRRLRRYFADLNDVVGHQESAARMRDATDRTLAPIEDFEAIQALLLKNSNTTSFTIIPGERVIRESSRLTKVDNNYLEFLSNKRCELKIDEEVFILYSHDYISYSFQSKVISLEDRTFRVKCPKILHYSERRSNQRGEVSGEGYFSLPVPWRDGEMTSWPVCERGPNGLSFRADPKEVYFWPETVLPGAVLRLDGNETVLRAAVVKHLTSMTDDQGESWLKVGVGYGHEKNDSNVSTDRVQIEKRSKSVTGRLGAIFGRISSGLSYLYHSRIKRLRQTTYDAPFKLVHFNNRVGRPIVGFLNTAFREKSRVRAPLVIITPGFGGRKETLSALAMTIVDNFRRQQRDIGVLRFDGTNNIGESYKDEDCRGEGRNAMNFTVSAGIDDLLGAVSWSRNNKFIDPTDIIVISVSFSSIAVRRALTMKEASDINRWICFMGAPDAQNAIMNVAGNVDSYDNYLRGFKTGVISLLGCLTNVDNFCGDMAKIQAATLEDACRDMAKIRADVTWIIGKYDAFMDPKRVKHIMSVKADGKRELVEVNAGHVPQSSDEALSEFAIIARQVWRHLYDRDFEAIVPSRGWLASVSELEWKRVRRQRPDDQTDYWHGYLFGEGGIGYDIWAITPEYKELIQDQINMLQPKEARILDLGAGTGNVSQAISQIGAASLTAMDIVPLALERVREKVAGKIPFTSVVASAEGSPRIGMRRWLRGELTSLQNLGSRMPASHHQALIQVSERYSDAMHAYLRGTELNLESIVRQANLPVSLIPLIKDVHILARLVQGRMNQSEAQEAVTDGFRVVIESRSGLPFEDASFDKVICSLVLSYLEFPDDALSEIRRILVPGGELVLSTLAPDADGSACFVNAVKYLESAPEEELIPGYDRQTLISALREFLNSAANLMRLEEEGIFKFWTARELTDLLVSAGFIAAEARMSMGSSLQAVIVGCRNP